MKRTRWLMIVALAIAVVIGQPSMGEQSKAGENGVITSVPRTMSYHGTLKDDGGEPVANQTVDIIFRIYDDPDAGTLEWDETINGIETDNDGRFSAELANVNIPFDEDYWLELEIVGDAGPMTPRQKLTMVGYAARADTADYAYNFPGGGSSHWDVVDSVLYTNNFWGIARGGYYNFLYGENAYTMVNLGGHSTTGTEGDDDLYSTVGGGTYNWAKGDASTVSGGGGNVASQYGSIGGGLNNLNPDGSWATIGGGRNNEVSGGYNTIGGGYYNEVTADSFSTIGGGFNNNASGDTSTISGGAWNEASGNAASIGGGGENTASGSNSSIGGGYGNYASGSYATIPGGNDNFAAGDYSLAAGRRARANTSGSFVWADQTDADFSTSAENQFIIRANGGVGIGTNNPTEQLHVNGSIRMVDGNEGDGKVLMSDADGVGSWQSPALITNSQYQDLLGIIEKQNTEISHLKQVINQLEIKINEIENPSR